MLGQLKVRLTLLAKNECYYHRWCVPYQCGFTPYRFFRFRFSMQFFAVAILFMVFDVELLLIIPYLINFYYYFETFQFFRLLIFLFFLFLGLVYE